MKSWTNVKLIAIFLIGFGVMSGVRSWLEIKKWEDNITIWPTSTLVPTKIPTPTLEPIRSVFLNVPFTSQAPFGEWSDPRHQDGCEEAASLMAVAARTKDPRFMVLGTVFDRQYASGEIERIWDWEVETYGDAHDTSALDTASRIIGRYFGHKSYGVRQIGDWREIVRELMGGNIVIVPTDGRLLKNPNFTGLGPERHMVVVKGYDIKTKEFITNDPGTRNGENYRYEENVLFEAVADYPTGNHQPVEEREKKMIVVGRVE